MNSITLIQKFNPLLDEVYKLSSLTGPLESDNTLMRLGANANEIIIPTISMDGLADYDRNSGYVSGDVKLENATVKLNYDRGRSFQVDAMDNEETQELAFGKLLAEFLRTAVIPELDSWRLAEYASHASGANVSTTTISTDSNLITELQNATAIMDENEVSQDQRYLFITPTLQTKLLTMDTYKSREILSRFVATVRIPQGRFSTSIQLYDGKTVVEEVKNGDAVTTAGRDERPGGYKKTGKDIDFLIVEKSAVMQYTKHQVTKIFSPEENQSGDAWKLLFRSYGLADVYPNKVSGIFCHHKA